MDRDPFLPTATVTLKIDDDAVRAVKNRLRDVCREHFESAGCSGADLDNSASVKPKKGYATFEIECSCGWEYSIQSRGLVDMTVKGPGAF